MLLRSAPTTIPQALTPGRRRDLVARPGVPRGERTAIAIVAGLLLQYPLVLLAMPALLRLSDACHDRPVTDADRLRYFEPRWQMFGAMLGL